MIVLRKGSIRRIMILGTMGRYCILLEKQRSMLIKYFDDVSFRHRIPIFDLLHESLHDIEVVPS